MSISPSSNQKPVEQFLGAEVKCNSGDPGWLRPHTSGPLWCASSWVWGPGSTSSKPRCLDSHLPFLQLPPQDLFSPWHSARSREMNLAFHALKSASMLPCLLLATLPSPSPRISTRWAPSFQSHRSTFLPTCKRKTWILSIRFSDSSAENQGCPGALGRSCCPGSRNCQQKRLQTLKSQFPPKGLRFIDSGILLRFL